jgi:hypothetical protein
MSRNQKILFGFLVGVFAVIILILAFALGVFVGRYNTRFFPLWRRDGFPEYFPRRFENHGLFGIIQELGNSSFVVKSKNGNIVTVLIDKNTKIKRGFSEIKFSDLKIGEKVIVLGEPQKDENAIKAVLIRVFEIQGRNSTPSGKINMDRFRFL